MMLFSTGPDDPRFYEVDDEFRQLLADLSPLVAASRMSHARVFHRTATAARGSLRVLDHPDLPAHGFFRPGRRFDVVARYSNGIESDDIAPAIRGITMRLSDPGAGAGLLDLSLITGDRFFARTADHFRRYSSGDTERAALVRDVPELPGIVWSMYRYATSFAEYNYHSQVPVGFIGADGRQWLLRYRLLPAGGVAEAGHFDPGELWLPPAPPGELTRDAADPRPRTFLHDELRSRLRAGSVEGVLQIQLHPVTDSAADNEAALDCTRPWSPDRYPWRDLATLHLDTLVDNAEVEGLRFNPGSAPAGLGVVLARSPHENASPTMLRTLMYRLTSAARRGDDIPADLAELVSPRRVSAGGCPFSGQRVADHAETPPTRTVAVVGAGPAGLSVARELERAGHRAIVLEALPDVGGKCESVDIDGRVYDLGGHVCTTQYENVAQLAVELGVATEDTTPHRVYAIDRGESVPQSAAFFQRDPFGRYAALREAEFPQIAEVGLAHSARALARPVSEWLADHGLESMAESLATGYTAAGYGYLARDLPALYFVKYAEMTGLLSARAELLGHPGSFTIVGGFKGLWEKVAAGLNDVRCGVTITSIERDADRDTGGVRIRTDRGEVVADDLVLTVPIDQFLPVIDATPDELDLAARVRHLDYYTTVVSATGLPRSAFHLIDEYTLPDAEPGHPVAFHHRYPDRDVYACYSYGADGVDGQHVVDRLREDVRRIGGELGEVHTQRRWRFLPHFGSDDLRDGVYDRIEHLQGRNHTYHAGSLPAYELVECNVAYSRQLVRQYFGEDDVLGHSAAVLEAPPPVVERPPPTLDALRDWLIEHIAAELQTSQDAIAPDTRLDSLALESISVAALQSGLSDWLGFRIPHTLFLEQPTIEAVARYLAVPETAAESEPAAPAHAQPSTLLLGLTAARPFFCVGGAVGAAYYLLPLARDVGSARPFYGVRAPGYDGAEEPLDTVEELAARYVESIRLIQPYGPYLLGGHSFGGVVAYEMGRQLRAAGEEVTRVVLLDTYVPVPGQPLPPIDDAAAIEELMTMNRLAFASGGPAGVEIDPSLAISEQKERLGRFLGANGSLPVEEHISNMLRVYQANIEANVKYQPLPSDLKVTLIKATGGFPPVMKPHRNTALKLDDPANGWEHVDLGELAVVEIPGDHFTMFVEPNDELLANAVHRCLADEQRRGANTLTGAGQQRGSAETTIAFNPLDPAFINDPYPFYRALRETAPIHYEDSIGGWVFTRHDDVSQLLRHPKVERPPVTDYLFASVPQADRDEMSEFERMIGEMLPFTNPPHHTRLRKLVSKAFTPRTVEAMRPRIQEITDRLLDPVEEAGRGELISQVAYRLPATVIMDFIGVPEVDHARMTFLATQLMKLLGAQYAADASAIARAAYGAMREFTAYLTALIAERRADPRDDLLSTLIAAGGPEGALTDEELILNCMALLNAGLETTANYLGNGTLALLRHPAQFTLLRDDPSLAESAAEELLRYDGPTPILTPQLAADDVEIGGQLIRKGQLLYPVIGAANRDPARYPDPERLDVTRSPSGQLSFGAGIHYCIGAALARVEGQVLFPTMARRFPNLRLDADAAPPTFRDDPVLRGLTALAVRVD
jgi:cytochrome P450/thioesterase domain-containing protein/protoporphyrinogen oxidase/acyl carrier protein